MIWPAAYLLPVATGHKLQYISLQHAQCQSPQATNFCDSVCCLPATSGHLPQTQCSTLQLIQCQSPHLLLCYYTSEYFTSEVWLCGDTLTGVITPQLVVIVWRDQWHLRHCFAFLAITPLLLVRFSNFFFSNVQKKELYPRTSHYPRVREPGPQNPRYIEVPVYYTHVYIFPRKCLERKVQ